MTPLSIVLLIILVIFTSLIIVYLVRHKGSNCGCCNGDCNKCEKNIKQMIEKYKSENKKS